jgi:hypothetical protein
MRRTGSLTTAAMLCACCATLLGACGSGTKTVTVSSVPPVSQRTASTKPSTPTATRPATTPAPTSTSGGTGTTSTHSAPEPAFTQQEAKAEGTTEAAAVVRSKGYTPNNTSDYHSNQSLRVLVGTRTGSADGYGQLAFFFVNGRYIGTDSKLPSATLRVSGQSDTEVTLAYPLYRKNDPLSSPTGGTAHVTFQLNNGKLVPLSPIPPANSSTGLSRQ